MKFLSLFFKPFKKKDSHTDIPLHLTSKKDLSLEDMYFYEKDVYFSSRIECVNFLLIQLTEKYGKIVNSQHFHDYKEELILKRFLEQYIPNILEKYNSLNSIEKEKGEDNLIELLRNTLSRVDKIILDNEERKLMEFNKEINLASHMIKQILEKDQLED